MKRCLIFVALFSLIATGCEWASNILPTEEGWEEFKENPGDYGWIKTDVKAKYEKFKNGDTPAQTNDTGANDTGANGTAAQASAKPERGWMDYLGFGLFTAIGALLGAGATMGVKQANSKGMPADLVIAAADKMIGSDSSDKEIDMKALVKKVEELKKAQDEKGTEAEA